MNAPPAHNAHADAASADVLKAVLKETTNDVIYETIVTTVAPDGSAHIAPMGVRYGEGTVVLMPFRPSGTLDNLLARRSAVLNVVTDTRVFAGCVTGRHHWATTPVAAVNGLRLTGALRHLALQLDHLHDDAQRPRVTLRIVEDVNHGFFAGFNRAQAAVIEGAVLVSRLHWLPLDRIEQEMAHLRVAIDKTASAVEHEAWGWLCDAVADHRERTIVKA